VLEPCNAKVLRTVLRGLGASNRAWLLGGCVASWGQDHLAGNGADFLLVLNSRTREEPMHEAKQMTTGQPVVQLHTRPVAFPPPRESAASQYRVGPIRFESGCVLVFHGDVFWCSSRMNGKRSSPVLRGLGGSNGARLLDHLPASFLLTRFRRYPLEHHQCEIVGEQGCFPKVADRRINRFD